MREEAKINADSLVTILPGRTHNGMAVKACELFKKHKRLATVAPSQMQALKEVCEKSTDWPSLRKSLEKFLDHQKERDEGVCTTGWQRLANDLQTSLKDLGEVLEKDAEELLERTARRANDISPDMADEIK